MDEMENEYAFSSEHKVDSDNNIYGEIKEEIETDEEVNSDKSGAAEFELDSFYLMKESSEEDALILDSTVEECTKESDFVLGCEEDEEKANLEIQNDKIDSVGIEPASLEPTKLNGKESDLILGGEEKEELAKESNEIIVMEELQLTTENANGDVVHEEDSIQKVKNTEVIPKKKKGKLIKKKVLKKKTAFNAMNKVIDANNGEPSTKENCQTVVELNDKVNGDDNEVAHEDAKQEVKNAEQTDKIVDKKIGKMRKRGLKDKLALTNKGSNDQEASNKVACEKAEQTGQIVVKNAEQTDKIVEKKMGKMKKRGLKNKIGLKGVNEVISKSTNDQGASNKIASERTKVAGMIFMCSSKTKNDCYHYKVFGLPSSKRDVVLEIREGMKLFLFDVELKELHGIYKAAGPGGYNIEPKAFKSAFPSQVRFNVYEDCLPVPEGKFKKVIKDNYYKNNKFHNQLTVKQVNNLCKLFQSASKGSKLKVSSRDLGARTHKSIPRESHKAGRDAGSARSRKQRRGVESRTFEDEKRSRKRRRVAENYGFQDPGRSRKQHRGVENRTFENRDWTAERYRDAYERKIYASPAIPATSRPALPPPPLALTFPPRSYAYKRTLESDAYRRDLPVEQPERRFRDLEYDYGRPSESNPYRRDLLDEQQDRRFRDPEIRHQGHIELGRNRLNEHRDAQFLDSELRQRREIEYREPRVYSDRHLYHNLSYSPAPQSEYLLHPRTSLHYAATPHDTGRHDQYGSYRSRY
ncbi:uncharacterized protein LOC126686836 [Mercurialis annua]|uniref:uncharacterized protein LOC126686836 n=1 Tax=Mercurialis annua TaxID=3986 RepID=UPI00215E5D22|nr:uncharacterized protein LOC126686836 [Mercurialis annua]